MENFASVLKTNLQSLIKEMSQSPEPFVKTPGIDFTRDRKLPFDVVMNLLIQMGGSDIYSELLEANGYELETATTSAFVQQRDKILPSAFEFVIHEMSEYAREPQTYRGYRLLASDGSDLNIATNPDDDETYFQTNQDAKGYNLLHLNALYDLCNRLYVDALVQPNRCMNEKRALTDMADRSQINDKVIVIADRNYESYNIFAHIEEKGWNYVIRVKDINSNGILSALKLPSDDEFDVNIRRVLSRKQTNEVKANPDIFRYIPNNTTFDYLPVGADGGYPLSFRVVRLKIADNSYETLVTNLDKSAFPTTELKELYQMRWGIETSFRELKYTVGLVNFHSKKREYIVQEIFARIIMYNFVEMITSHAVISKSDRKYDYKVNFSVAVRLCRKFLRLFHNALPPDTVLSLICKNIVPIRPDRTGKRVIRTKTTVSFMYRVA